ncbi:MAG: VCBS repeat-containing protein [Saprospiraceae bacterium]|nr:VCBS repeat-containing protein [Saprospiraceae bacterium]
MTEETWEAKQPLLRLRAPEETGVTFENRIEETYEVNITTNINMYNGGGVAALDINNDNLPDLFFIGSSGPNGLFLNEGNMKFRDITVPAGLTATEGFSGDNGFETAATAVDINADGFLDIYVCRSGPKKEDSRRNKLYINNGDLTFTEKAAAYGLDDFSASTGANFFDFDNDGDLDLYLLNHPEEKTYTNLIEATLGPDNKYHPNLQPHNELDCDRFYRNDGGKFTDITKQAGIWNYGYGLSVSVSDFNHDGWTDVFVGNDFMQPDELYINNKNGTFTDRLGEYFRHTAQHTMGTDLSDFDNDGLIDIFAADMLGEKNARQKLQMAINSQSNYGTMMKNGYFEPVVRNVLQRANGDGTFSDVGCIAGVYKTDWSWSGLLADLDNDGLRDLHVTNGYRRETNNRDFVDFTLPEIGRKAGGGKKLRDIYPELNEFLDIIPTTRLRNYVFANKGNWQFESKGGQWMTMPGSWSCGAVWTDLDADGDLDLVTNNLEQPAFVYENLARQQSGNHYLQCKLQGAAPNPFAVGASVRIEYNNGQVQYYENFPTRGIFSSVEHLVHFGLGETAIVNRLMVRWPDGKTQELTNVPADQRLTLRQSDASGYVATIVPQTIAKPIFADHTAASGLGYNHQISGYNDFDQFPLLPWTIADQDPLMAVGDVNGDGLDDVYIGGSFNHTGAVYAQQPGGKFIMLSPKLFEQEKPYNDHGAVFFDADNDRDLDLLVLSGGPEAKRDFARVAWQNRLYINLDGQGSFGKAANALPDFGDNLALRAAAYDIDGDGDQDVVCGGRFIPGQWPLTPRTIVLRNDLNKLTDITAQVAPELERCGMVTDLAWVNLDSDPEKELVVVGEWMPVSVFDLQNGKLVNVNRQYGLDKSNGIWYRLATADLDGDGDQDLVTGNLGLNTRLTATPTAPLRCYAADFDKNGTIDPLMAYFEDGKEYPLYQKEVLNRQMPILKKRLLYAKDYASATIDQVWPRKDLDAGLVLSAYTLETCWWENKNGTFVAHPLPLQAQLAPVQGIAVFDVNADGILDLVLAGNKYGFEVETNRCDSSNGCVLSGDGKGGFKWWNNTMHGFWANREARDLALLANPGGKPLILVSNSNSPAQVYQFQNPSGKPVQ